MAPITANASATPGLVVSVGNAGSLQSYWPVEKLRRITLRCEPIEKFTWNANLVQIELELSTGARIATAALRDEMVLHDVIQRDNERLYGRRIVSRIPQNTYHLARRWTLYQQHGTTGTGVVMTVVTSEQRYQRGDASAEQLQEVIDEVLEQLAKPGSEVADAARAVGLAPTEISAVTVGVREGEQGAEPVLTTIVVGIAVSAGSKVAETLWTEVIWPRLRRRLGAKALGAPTATPAEEE